MDRKLILLAAAAIPLGLAGGYAWSVLTAPKPPAYVAPTPTMAAVPASPDEYPAAVDEAWEIRADDNATADSANGVETNR